MKLCKKCGKIADYDSYSGAFVCSKCNWKDDTPNRKRLEFYNSTSKALNEIRCCQEKKKTLINT